MEVWQTLSAVFAGLCVGLIGVALARLPRSPVAPPLYAFVACGVLWAVGDLIADSAAGMASKQAGIALLYSGAIPLPALWWMVVIRWSQEVGANLPFSAPAWTRVPLAFAAILWLVMLTNPWHGAFLTPVLGGRNEYHLLWYVMTIPNYLLILAALVLELTVAYRTAIRDVRRQAAFLTAASLVTLFGNMVYVLHLTPLNLTSLVLSTSGVLLVVGMAREGLFGVLPSAMPGIAAAHPDGLVLVGPTGHLRYANARAHRLLAPIVLEQGALVGDLLDDQALRPSAPRDGEQIGEEAWWRWLTTHDVLTCRFVDGQVSWLYLTATEVLGRRGGLKGYCLRISDLTDLKQSEAHLRQTRRLDSVASFARSVTRRLQGIFAVIHGNADLMSSADGGPGDAAHERRIARILEAARHGIDLSRQLQLFTGTLDTTRVRMELSGVVQEVCERVESDLPDSIHLDHVRSDEILPVNVDAVQIRHCIHNLLVNAVEAMGEVRGTIRVRTGMERFDPAERELVYGADQPAGDFAYVRIRDEGGGMEPAVEESAFEPFCSTRGKDRGNGLPAVFGIARAHGALIALDNEYGRGCTFTLYFPLEFDFGSA